MCCRKLGLSREDFASMVGMNCNSVANWSKKGIPSWETPFYLNKKAKYLDTILDILKKYQTSYVALSISPLLSINHFQ